MNCHDRAICKGDRLKSVAVARTKRSARDDDRLASRRVTRTPPILNLHLFLLHHQTDGGVRARVHAPRHHRSIPPQSHGEQQLSLLYYCRRRGEEAKPPATEKAGGVLLNLSKPRDGGNARSPGRRRKATHQRTCTQDSRAFWAPARISSIPPPHHHHSFLLLPCTSIFVPTCRADLPFPEIKRMVHCLTERSWFSERLI
jgi:hypothetical protein